MGAAVAGQLHLGNGEIAGAGGGIETATAEAGRGSNRQELLSGGD